MVRTRKEVPQEDRWNVEAIYPNLEAWEEHFQQLVCQPAPPYWPDLIAYRGRLGESPELLKEVLDRLFLLDRELSRLYTYAHLRHDEDIADDIFKQAFNKILTVTHHLHQETSWVEPELLALSEDIIQKRLNHPLLQDYRFHLEKIFRLKPYVLNQEQEHLIAMAGQALQSCQRVFSAINDADFVFGSVKDQSGKEHELTHATYGVYLRAHDRTLRKNTFLQMHTTYFQHQNTFCELLNGTVQNHLFNARAHRYHSCLDASLFSKNIDTAVYHSLIEAVNTGIGSLHRYVELRKRLFGMEQLHLYDMYPPLTPDMEMHFSYEEAEDLVIESVAPLGVEYQDILRKGLKQQRWVDRYENKQKRSGAYSSGCYDTMPYILMNYKNFLRDLYVLAHEVGHSMHSELTRKAQPYQYASYPIFLAEVASTFNEDLLSHLMLKRAKSTEEKIYLLTQKIEDLRGTLFRQTLFAEFELFIHQMAEKQISLTPGLLREKFRALTATYFGPSVIIDQVAEAEWARIPHFYYNFYVYQYATGISAALALSEKVIQGDKRDREAYLNFLKGGSSRYPIEMLQAAGVDMRTPAPVQAVMAKFDHLVAELEALLEKK